jgi:hypothetical protein
MCLPRRSGSLLSTTTPSEMVRHGRRRANWPLCSEQIRAYLLKLCQDNLQSQLIKKGNTVSAHELARRYGDQGIVSTSLTPGKRGCQSLESHKLSRAPQASSRPICNAICVVSRPFLTQLYAGTHPEGESLNGKVCFLRSPSFKGHFLTCVVSPRPETLDEPVVALARRTS